MADAVHDARQYPWFRLHDAIIDLYGRDLGPIGVALYAALARHANKEGTAYPSLSTLQGYFGLSRPAVIKYLKRLESLQLIAITLRYGHDGDRTSNLYTLLPHPESTPSKPDCLPSKPDCLPSKPDLPEVLALRVYREGRETPSVSTTVETSPPLTPLTLLEMYNALTPDTHPKVEKLTDARQTKAQRYLRQFPDGAFWEKVMQEIGHSAFLLGLNNTHEHAHFKATFDWLLTKGKDGTENCIKVYEGRYRDATTATRRFSEKEQRSIAASQRIMEEYANARASQPAALLPGAEHHGRPVF
jgi:hypothetical protein